MSNIEPVVPNLQAATTALQNKYARPDYRDPTSLLAALNGLPIPPHLNLRAATQANTILPLARYDMARANRGLAPLGPRQSAAALQTLTTGQPATPPRRQGLFRSAVSDLRALVSSIPKLPIAAVHELQALPEALSDFPEAVSSADNPIEAVGNVANLPGFRLIPGSFVAGAFGEEGQGVQQLLAHPLFTALDVLPLASGAAAKTAVVKGAREAAVAENAARVEQAIALTGQPGTARLMPKPRPLSTLATRTLDEAGNVVPNVVGRATASGRDLLGSTAPGRAISATFLERDTSRIEARQTSALRRIADLNSPRATLPTKLNGRSILPELDLRDQVITFNEMAEAAGVDSARNAELFRLAEDPRLPDGTPTSIEQLPGLTTQERALIQKARDINRERARLTEGDLTGIVTVDGTPEVYDIATARRLSRAQNSLSTAQEIANARQLVADPSTVTPETIRAALDDIADRRAAGTLSGPVADDLARTYAAALDEAGYVTDDAGTISRVSRPDDATLLAALRPLARRYPTIPRLIDHLSNARWSSARKDLDAFAGTRAGATAIDNLPFDIDGLKAELSRRIRRDRVLARTAKFSPRYLKRLGNLVDREMTRAVPARFQPAIQAEAASRITSRVSEIYSGSPDLERMTEMAGNRVYDAISELPEAEVRLIQRQTRDTWRALRDAGHDPVFFSRVTPQQRARLPYTRVSDAPVTPAAARARMFDATPHVADMGVALTRDMMDLVQRRGTEAFLDEIEATFARPRSEVVADLYPRAEARFAASPNVPLQTHLSNLINERFQPWDRSRYTPKTSSPAFPVSGRDQSLIPRVQAENIERLFKPPLPKLTALFDPIMRVFRTSVLPLAPRWHIYNAVGGGAMTAVEDAAAFRYLPEVIREMWANRESAGGVGAKRTAHQLQPEGAPPSGFGTMPAEVRAWDHEIRATSPLKDRLAATHNYAAGRTLRTWWDQVRNSRLGRAASTGVEKSYNANQLVDDMYRSAIGISSRKRALKAGLSDDMAEAVAVDSIRRVFQAWDEMTPMERSIMRTVVPFYGWASHILRYAFRYPADHPFRTAVAASFARAELSDSLTGLPDHIRDMILMGDVRANGVVRGINVGPFNPFRDLPSNFTVAGFLGNLNPVLTGVLESVGVNTQQGGPSLYPETRYDPETGRLVADPGGNLLSNILGNISPQTNLLTALIGRNESFNQLLARDPEAAGRQLMSNLGIPVLYRSIDVGEELIRAEQARFEDQENARREALKTGDLSILGDFPGLAAYGAQVRALEAGGQLDALRPTAGQPGVPDNISRAYALQTALLGSGQ